MRPLRLSLTAFGPYAGTEVVDFDALTELGLFVVAGNNGSGKTTIFDALHYGLFGTLPGRRASYIRLKSDHAGDSAECKVVLDFVAHGTYWRVERSPKQKRPKRRGTGFTEVDRRAALYRLDQGQDGPATAITNRIGEVDDQCRQLVGLSGKQFERVALLPQGEFSRVLRESSTDRRELLRTLFSSELFGDATTWLTDQAAAATAKDRAAFERLDHQQTALGDELEVVLGSSLARTVDGLTNAIHEGRRVQVAELTTTASTLEATAAQAAHAHQAAVDLGARIERRDQVRHAFQDHQNEQDQHERDLARLGQARAAVPVTSNSRSLSQHQRHLDAALERTDALHAQLNRSLDVAGVDQLAAIDDQSLAVGAETLAGLAQQLADCSQAARRASELDALTKRSQGELRRLANEATSLDQQREVAHAQLRQANNELTQLADIADAEQCETDLRLATAQLAQRTKLATTESEHLRVVRAATQVDAAIEQLQDDLDIAQQAATQHSKLQGKADTALAAFEAATRRRDAAQRYQSASHRLEQARGELGGARGQAERLWDAFIAGTAARVAETLADGDACPVCGSEEHPAPAINMAPGELVTESDVAAARALADDLRETARRIEAEIEALRATDTDIASLSLTELAAEITTTKAMALGARTIADEARQVAARSESLRRELAVQRQARADLEVELRQLDQHRSRLEGALGDSANETIHTLELRVSQASAARSKADDLVARRAELTNRILMIEQDIDTIGLGQIAAENRRTSATDSLVERQTELKRAQTALADLETALTTTENTDHVPSANFEQRAQATRRSLELLTKLGTARAVHNEAGDAVRRAQSILDERLTQSPFASVQAALAAFVDPHIIRQLEAQTTAHAATGERLQGQLHELDDLPGTAPDTAGLAATATATAASYAETNRSLIALTTNLDRIETDLVRIATERKRLQTDDLATRRLERVAALAKGDNDRNTSLENWVLAAHLRDVVELANVRLARSTHQRFQLCVLDDGENKRGKWGLDLGVEDTVTGTRRPTAGLSGGELFQASLALALGLADAVMNQSAGVRIDALFIDEGFGSLDEVSVERAIDLLDELRDRGAMVGVITHVPALLDALPVGVSVIDAPDGHGSTIRQNRLAA